MVKTKANLERLKVLKYKGQNILVCDFSHCSRDEGRLLLTQLLARVEKESEASVRLLLCVEDTTHDASHTNEWKRHLDTFGSRLKKSAVVGLSSLNRVALAGLHMYARMMGHEKISSQAKPFDTREAALDYLAADK
jgi:hypothetical protein